MKLAKERGYKNVLILEDDFTFLTDRETLDKSLNTFFNDVGDDYVCMLCCQTLKKKEKNLFLSKQSSSCQQRICLFNKWFILDTIIELYDWAFPLLNLLENIGITQMTKYGIVFKKQVNGLYLILVWKTTFGYSDNAKRFMDYDT